MRTPAYLCLLLTCMLISCTPTQEKHEIDYTSYVNPFIGTDFTGNTYPGAQAPFGMVQLSPDNGLPGWDRISGYFYPDSTIAGFSHTHLSGTGAGDLYDISFMPVTLPYKEAEAPLGIHSKFSHKDESAHAERSLGTRISVSSEVCSDKWIYIRCVIYFVFLLRRGTRNEHAG